MRSFSFGSMALVLPLSLAVSAGLAMAAPYTVFSDNFSGDTDTFAYPDSVGHPAGPPQVGAWNRSDATNPGIAAGIITNTPPGGGANGNTHYMAMQRTNDNFNAMAALFSMPVTAANGTLDIQWDEASDGSSYDSWLSTTPNFNQNGAAGGNVTGFFRRNYPVQNNIRVYSNNWGNSQDFSDAYHVSTAFGHWFHMEQQVDLAAQTYNLYVDNTLVGSNLPYIASQTAGYGISEIVWGGTFTGGSLYIDNLVATVSIGPTVPEPVTGSLMLLSGGLFLLRRRSSSQA